MKLLISLTAVSLLSLASFNADATGARGKLFIDNDSKDAIAVGGEILAVSGSHDWGGSEGSLLYMAGKRANAGSVVVNGCPCRKKTVLSNKSRGALAIGAANAGSIVLNAGYSR